MTWHPGEERQSDSYPLWASQGTRQQVSHQHSPGSGEPPAWPEQLFMAQAHPSPMPCRLYSLVEEKGLTFTLVLGLPKAVSGGPLGKKNEHLNSSGLWPQS